jgi:hypothetical protein
MGLSASNDNRPGPLAGFMPRGLSRVQAAAYVGVSPSLFDEMVRDGRMPAAKRVNSRTIWDLRKLDVAFDALPGDQSTDVNPWDLAV